MDLDVVDVADMEFHGISCPDSLYYVTRIFSDEALGIYMGYLFLIEGDLVWESERKMVCLLFRSANIIKNLIRNINYLNNITNYCNISF